MAAAIGPAEVAIGPAEVAIAPAGVAIAVVEVIEGAAAAAIAERI
jgi:hypothetical protein